MAFFFRYAWLFSLFINLTLLVAPLYMLQVYDRVLTSRSLETLAMLSLGVLAALLVYAALEGLRSRLLVQAGLALDAILTPQVLRHAFNHASQPGGVRHAGVVRDVGVLRQYLTGNGPYAFFDAPWGLAFLGLIFLMHWALGVTALIGMTILVGLALLDEVRTRPLLLAASSANSEAARYLDGALRNAQPVAAMGLRDAIIARWRARNEVVLAAQGEASDRAGIIIAASKCIRLMLQSAMLGLGAYLVIVDNLSSGVMIAATILLSRATSPIELATAGWKGFVDARAAYDRLDKLLSVDAVVPARLSLPRPSGVLDVERIVYAAAPGEKPIVRGVSFSLAAGQCLAVIGPSAAGKSTLVRLLLGIWRPQSGHVRLDSADLWEWPDHSVGPYLGYLPQDVELLSGTVGENIARMGDADQYSNAIIEAAKLAGAHEMILRLPKGYDTEIGEGGAVISGGQRQRIGLARALFGDPALIVLDEPNANLDSEGEAALLNALKELKARRRTVVYVTHKPSLLNPADSVLVLDAGQVIAKGPREQVLAQLNRSRPPMAGILPASAALPQEAVA